MAVSGIERIEVPGARGALYVDAPCWDGRRTMALGQVRIDDAEGGAPLIALAVQRAQSLGAASLVGPMDGDTWHSYRLVTESDGSKPFLMEPTLGADAQTAFEALGFAVIERYFSAKVCLATVLDQADPQDGIAIQPWDGQDAEALFSEIHALSSDAFAGNVFYQPVSLPDFLALYRPFLRMIRPELVFLARDQDDVLQGYLFGIPNYAEGPTTRTAILKTYASRVPGLGRALASRFHSAAGNAGFQTAIHALIHDANRSAERSAGLGATIFRRYALMGRVLDGG